MSWNFDDPPMFGVSSESLYKSTGANTPKENKVSEEAREAALNELLSEDKRVAENKPNRDAVGIHVQRYGDSRAAAAETELKRYRWLKAQSGIQLDNARKGGKWACRPAITNYAYTLFQTMDEAIDNAMKGEQ